MAESQWISVPERRWRPWLRLLLAVLAVQLCWWLIVQPLLFAKAKAPERIPIVQASAAEPAGPDWASVQAAIFQPIELPYHDCCHEPGYRAVRVHFDLDALPAEGLGLIANTYADNFSLHVNDQPLSVRGRMRLPDISYHGQIRQIYFVSPGLLQMGRNSLTIVMVRSAIGEFAVAPPLLASYPEMMRQLAWRDFILTDYNLISATVGLVLALLALVLMLRSRERAAAAWCSVLLLTWVARLVMLESADPPFGGLTRLALGYVQLGLLPVAWLNFIDAWTGRPLRWLAPLSLGLLSIYALACVWVLWSQPLQALDRLDLYLAVFASVASLAVVARLLWHTVRAADPRVWEAALFLLCVTLIVVDMVQMLSGGGGFFSHTNISVPLLMLALALSFLARNIHLFRSMNEFNQLLSTRLTESEAQLRQGWQERQALARQTALAEERQRIMRDMHDGIGGKLVSLAAQLRGVASANAGAGIDPASLSRELLEALDDMRLIVDSLDTAGDDLGMALGAFRARMAPRWRDAGLASHWQIDPAAASLELPAGAILDIYRILQEACANVLRHAGATALWLNIRLGQDGQLWIEVQDNGCGTDGQARHGHGLANMRARANRLGGQLEWLPARPGTCVRLRLPASLHRRSETAASPPAALAVTAG